MYRSRDFARKPLARSSFMVHFEARTIFEKHLLTWRVGRRGHVFITDVTEADVVLLLGGWC
jgi:hypothetical protein